MRIKVTTVTSDRQPELDLDLQPFGDDGQTVWCPCCAVDVGFFSDICPENPPPETYDIVLATRQDCVKFIARFYRWITYWHGEMRERTLAEALQVARAYGREGVALVSWKGNAIDLYPAGGVDDAG